jgi:signal transduction histidine kinase
MQTETQEELPAWVRRSRARRELRAKGGDDPDMSIQLLLNTVTRVQARMVQEKGVVLTELFNELLLTLLDLTDSEYGFIGEVKYNGADPYLATYSTTDIAWSAGTRQFWENFGKNGAGLEFTNLKTLFGTVLTSKKPVISNSPGTDERRGGLPPGHPPMHSFCGLPFFAGEEMIGMIGIANRPGGFSWDLVEFLEPLLITCGNLTTSARITTELVKSKEFLDLAASAANVGLWIAQPAPATVHDKGVDVQESPEEPLCHPSARINFSAECGLLFEGERKEIESNLGAFLERIHTEDRPHFMKAWIDHLRNKKPFDVEIRIQSFSWDAWLQSGQRKHRYRHFQARGQAQWIGQDAVRIAGSLVDITALVQAREAAIAALNVKTQFLATMSHELRSPLNSVIGNTTMTLETDVTTEQREYLEAARDSGHFLLGLIDDVLDLSKIEAARMVLDPHPFSLRRVIKEVAKAFSQEARTKKLDLIQQVSPDVQDNRWGDATRLRQVITNLVSNSIKFTTSGQVVISLLNNEEDEVLFSVKDTGIGIPSESLGAIFEPFTQQDSSTTRKHGGSGLGLTISKNLVRMMGGNLTVASTVGEGSNFSFGLVLPIWNSQIVTSPTLSSVSSKRWNTLLTPDPSDASVETDYFGHRWGIRLDALKMEEKRTTSLEPSKNLSSPPLIMYDPLNPSPSGTPAPRKAKVLLAEDNPVNQKMMERLLQKAGHQVECAENGKLAVDLFLAKRDWDVILMDIQSKHFIPKNTNN